MTTSHFKDTSSCPKQYLKLRSIISKKQREVRNARTVSSKRIFTRFLSAKYPALRKEVGLGSGVDAIKLLRILDLPVSSSCVTCQKTILADSSFRLRLYCSRLCMQTSALTHEKRCKTNKARTGFENCSQDPVVKRKKIDIELLKSGGKYDHPLRDPEVQKRKMLKCRRLTGFDSYNQVPEIREKQQKAAKELRLYVSPTGIEHWCRGYEPQALAYLYSNENVKSVSTKVNTSLLPLVRYTRPTGKRAIYFPDIGVELKDGRRLIIEVKSEHTLWWYEELNRAKFKAASQVAKTRSRTEFWLAVVCERTKTITWSTCSGYKATTSIV